MKYFYFFLTGLVALAALYSLAGIAVLKWDNYKAEHPKAEFLVMDHGTNTLTITDFTNYTCGYCKEMHSVIKETLSLQKNIRYISRPILLELNIPEDQRQKPVALEKLALAAGLQNKFQEMHDMFMEYPKNLIPEELLQETAELYGINYQKMVEDAKSDKIQKYLDNNFDNMISIKVESIPSYVVNNNIYTVGNTRPDLKTFLSMIENEKR